MVFLTGVRLLRNVTDKITKPNYFPGPDKYWKVQQFWRFAWRFHGRKKHCYRIAMRYVHKALKYATVNRQVRKGYMKNLWETRIDAAAMEHGLEQKLFMEGLAREHIQLDRKVLTDLAVYEPRTFQSLVGIAQKRVEEDELDRRYMKSDSPIKIPKALLPDKY